MFRVFNVRVLSKCILIALVMLPYGACKNNSMLSQPNGRNLATVPTYDTSIVTQTGTNSQGLPAYSIARCNATNTSALTAPQDVNLTKSSTLGPLLASCQSAASTFCTKNKLVADTLASNFFPYGRTQYMSICAPPAGSSANPITFQVSNCGGDYESVYSPELAAPSDSAAVDPLTPVCIAQASAICASDAIPATLIQSSVTINRRQQPQMTGTCSNGTNIVIGTCSANWASANPDNMQGTNLNTCNAAANMVCLRDGNLNNEKLATFSPDMSPSYSGTCFDGTQFAVTNCASMPTNANSQSNLAYLNRTTSTAITNVWNYTTPLSADGYSTVISAAFPNGMQSMFMGPVNGSGTCPSLGTAWCTEIAGQAANPISSNYSENSTLQYTFWCKDQVGSTLGPFAVKSCWDPNINSDVQIVNAGASSPAGDAAGFSSSYLNSVIVGPNSSCPLNANSFCEGNLGVPMEANSGRYSLTNGGAYVYTALCQDGVGIALPTCYGDALGAGSLAYFDLSIPQTASGGCMGNTGQGLKFGNYLFDSIYNGAVLSYKGAPVDYVGTCLNGAQVFVAGSATALLSATQSAAPTSFSPPSLSACENVMNAKCNTLPGYQSVSSIGIYTPYAQTQYMGACLNTSTQEGQFFSIPNCAASPALTIPIGTTWAPSTTGDVCIQSANAFCGTDGVNLSSASYYNGTTWVQFSGYCNGGGGISIPNCTGQASDVDSSDYCKEVATAYCLENQISSAAQTNFAPNLQSEYAFSCITPNLTVDQCMGQAMIYDSTNCQTPQYGTEGSFCVEQTAGFEQMCTSGALPASTTVQTPADFCLSYVSESRTFSSAADGSLVEQSTCACCDGPISGVAGEAPGAPGTYYAAATSPCACQSGVMCTMYGHIAGQFCL